MDVISIFTDICNTFYEDVFDDFESTEEVIDNSIHQLINTVILSIIASASDLRRIDPEDIGILQRELSGVRVFSVDDRRIFYGEIDFLINRSEREIENRRAKGIVI